MTLYEIRRRGEHDWEPWDGPYGSLREARVAFDRKYRLPGSGRKQDFAVFRVVSKASRCKLHALPRQSKAQGGT